MWHEGFQAGFKAADGLPAPIDQRRKEQAEATRKLRARIEEEKSRPKPERYFFP